MKFDLFESRLLLPIVIVLALALGGAMAFATSLMHSGGSEAAGSSS